MAATLALVLVVALVVAGRATRAEFDAFVERELSALTGEAPDLAPFEQELVEQWSAGGWAVVEPLLEDIERRLESRYQLLFLPGADAPRVDGRGDVPRGLQERFVLFEKSEDGPLRSHHVELNAPLAGGLAELQLTARDGEPIGRLLAVPRIESDRAALRRGFLAGLGRWFAAGLAGAALVGLLLAGFLARRIAAPLADLTRAARALEERPREAAELAAGISRRAARGSDEVAELGAAFHGMARALARSEDLRKRLTADVAHELRTPLTNLRCRIEAMQDGLVEGGAESVAVLADEVRHLSRLVDDLLTLSVAEAGALPLECTAVDAAAVVREVCATQEPGQAPVLYIAGAPRVHADATRLRQVLANLVANARHAAPDGRLEVGAEAHGDRVRMWVEDDGPGIPEEQRDAVFERFLRLDPSRSRDTGGAGLGLSIVRGLVQAMGGDVRLELEPGRTRFAVELPAARTDSLVRGAAVESTLGPASRP